MDKAWMTPTAAMLAGRLPSLRLEAPAASGVVLECISVAVWVFVRFTSCLLLLEKYVVHTTAL